MSKILTVTIPDKVWEDIEDMREELEKKNRSEFVSELLRAGIRYYGKWLQTFGIGYYILFIHVENWLRLCSKINIQTNMKWGIKDGMDNKSNINRN